MACRYKSWICWRSWPIALLIALSITIAHEWIEHPGGDLVYAQTGPGNNLIKGQPDAAPADMTNAARDIVLVWNVPDPVTGDDGDYQVEVPAACTLQEVHCNTQGASTTVTINLYERSRTTPETGTTDMVTTDPVCDNDGDTETVFTDAGIADNAPVALGVQAVSGTPTMVRVYATCRRD